MNTRHNGSGCAKSARAGIPVLATILAIFCSHAIHAQQPLFSLIRKIKVDANGAAGASDGCAFSTKGDLIAASDNSGLLKIYRISDGVLVKQLKHSESNVSGADGEMNAIHFSTDDKLVVTGMNKTGAKVWNVANGEMVKNLGRGSNTDGAAFSPNGKWLAVAQGSSCVIYELPGYTKIASMGTGGYEVNSIDWSSDASIIAFVASGAPIKIYRTSDWTQLHSISFGIYRVKSIRISPDNTLAAVSGQRGRVRVYRISDARQVADLAHTSDLSCLPGDDDDGSEPNVEAVAWSGEGRFLFTGGQYDGVVRVWRVIDWSMVGWVYGQAHNRQVEFMDFGGNNVLASAGDEGYLYLNQFNVPPSRNAIQQSVSTGNAVWIEAEDFDANVPQGEHRWDALYDNTASATRKVQALPDKNVQRASGFAVSNPLKDSPKLDYRIHFAKAGTYQFWARIKGVDSSAAKIHAGLNGKPLASADRIVCNSRQWSWSKSTRDNVPATITIPDTGNFTLNLWMCDDGVEVDKLLLTTDASYAPEGTGFQATTRLTEITSVRLSKTELSAVRHSSMIRCFVKLGEVPDYNGDLMKTEHFSILGRSYRNERGADMILLNRR